MLFVAVGVSAGYNPDRDAVALRSWQQGSLSGRGWGKLLSEN